MRDRFCDYCKFQLKKEDEFCPECGIPVIQLETKPDEYYICSVCQSENIAGERKCKHCCSII